MRRRYPPRTESRRHRIANATPTLDDEQRFVSAPGGRLLAAKSGRIGLPDTSPNCRVRALSCGCRQRQTLAPVPLWSHDKALPRDDLRLPDERARLRAHEGHARVARLQRGSRARAGRPDPVQHLLDPRDRRQPLPRAPRRGQTPQARTARADRRRRRLLGTIGQGGGLRALPLRRRGLRPRAGPQARGVPHQRLAHRPGLLRVRGLHRPAASAPRAALPGVGADQRRLQLPLLLLHRALDPRPRGQPPL